MSNTNILAIANETFNMHQRVEVLNMASAMAKNEGIPSSKIKKLHQEKGKLAKKISANESQILSRMTLSCNTYATSKDSWVFVRYQDDQSLDTKLALVAVSEGCLSTIQVDNRVVSQLSKDKLDSMMPLIEDIKAIEAFENQACLLAIDELKALGFHVTSSLMSNPMSVLLDVELSEPEKKDETSHEALPQQAEEDIELTVSLHSGKRYVQRVLGILDDASAEAYYRANTKAVKRAIIYAVDKAEQVWRDRDDKIDYRLDDDNIIYVIGHDQAVPKVITLYELEFGFTKEINRTISLEQIKVLHDYHARWLETESIVAIERVEAMDRLTSVDQDIAVLKAQLRAKEAERKSIDADIDQMNSTVVLAEQVFTKEHSKLFKKWRIAEGL
jgi:hypothetical protein